MRMIDTVIKPMHAEGYKFVAAFAVVTALLFWIWDPLRRLASRIHIINT